MHRFVCIEHHFRALREVYICRIYVIFEHFHVQNTLN